ncbi:MAG: hypothetical protein KAS04_06615 [Candidatus Aenigmarchaeota archaeon]|nr:hypothetical protein [Candidatus Aenigmarchaeota archaeon]
MDLKECLRKGMIRKTRIDHELIKSLIEMSEIKKKTVETADVNEYNISAYVSLAYDSLREVLEGLCILKGYKVLSHVCVGELLKKEIPDFDYNQFDRIRWIRNSINYYGEKVDFMQGKEIIKKIFNMKFNVVKNHLKSI